jgi:hypothetical protein
MSKKIIGSLGLIAGLGFTMLLLYNLFIYNGELQPLAQSPPGQAQEALRPMLEPPQQPKIPASLPAVSLAPGPPVIETSAPPAVTTVPTPEPSPVEKEVAPLPPLEPKGEHGLLAGKYRRYGEAQKVLEKINKQNLPALIRKKGKHFEVWAGPFPTSQEAEQARKSLRSAIRISSQKGKLAMPVPK